MKTYPISFRSSKDGKSWTRSTTHVKAESDMSARAQLETKYPYVVDVRIMSVK